MYVQSDVTGFSAPPPEVHLFSSGCVMNRLAPLTGKTAPDFYISLLVLHAHVLGLSSTEKVWRGG